MEDIKDRAFKEITRRNYAIEGLRKRIIEDLQCIDEGEFDNHGKKYVDGKRATLCEYLEVVGLIIEEEFMD